MRDNAPGESEKKVENEQRCTGMRCGFSVTACPDAKNPRRTSTKGRGWKIGEEIIRTCAAKQNQQQAYAWCRGGQPVVAPPHVNARASADLFSRQHTSFDSVYVANGIFGQPLEFYVIFSFLSSVDHIICDLSTVRGLAHATSAVTQELAALPCVRITALGSAALLLFYQ